MELQRQKEAVRRRLAALFVERGTVTFEQRKRLFTDRDKLLRFAKRTLPVICPMLWDELCEFCEERDYGLSNAVAIAAGNQLDYETQPISYSGAKRRFDLYLQEAIGTCLADWKKEEQEYDNSEEAETEPPTIGEETETITIELPSESQCQDEGF